MKNIFLLFLIILLFPIFVLGAVKIDINTATLAQLDGLNGVGPVMAQRIIDARPFSSVDDLDRVNGIGPATLQKIKDQGLACVGCESSIISSTTTPVPSPTTSPVETLKIIYPDGVFINEIMPNPKGADETDEWVELYNSNNFEIDLSGWRIQDINGTPKTFTIPKNTKILANGFLVFKRPETKIMLNNNKDGLNLLTPDGKIVDSVTFTSAPLAQSYNKIGSSWTWSATLTPGAKNIIPATKTLPKAKNSVNSKATTVAAADLSQAINLNQDNTQNSNPWFLFFAVLIITIILSVIVLIIKLKFKNNVRT